MTHSQIILNTLQTIKHGTCMEIAAYNTLTYRQVLPRMRELERIGLVYDTHRKGNTPKKVCAIVWGIKEVGSKEETLTLFDQVKDIEECNQNL